MTVKRLIEQLQKMPPGLPVMQADGEGLYYEFYRVRLAEDNYDLKTGDLKEEPRQVVILDLYDMESTA